MSRFVRFLGLACLFWGLPAVTCAALSPFAEMLLERVEVLEDADFYLVDAEDLIVGPVVGYSQLPTVAVEPNALFVTSFRSDGPGHGESTLFFESKAARRRR
jgi:hypothetical protein